MSDEGVVRLSFSVGKGESNIKVGAGRSKSIIKGSEEHEAAINLSSDEKTSILGFRDSEGRIRLLIRLDKDGVGIRGTDEDEAEVFRLPEVLSAHEGQE